MIWGGRSRMRGGKAGRMDFFSFFCLALALARKDEATGGMLWVEMRWDVWEEGKKENSE